jgi:genome|nr:MAG TPA: hypothetical protein [Caudoviricetes sp.]
MLELISRKIGTFKLDTTEQEENKSTLRTTKNPIESGANVADHAVLEPKQITIKGKIVAYEPPSFTQFDEITQIIRFNLPFIKTAHRFTQKAYKLYNNVKHIKNEAMRYAKIFGIDKKAREIAPFLTDGNSNKDDSAAKNRLQSLYEKLLEIQKSGEFLEVTTGLRTYKNMLITSIEITTESDLYADAMLTLEEVFVVETKTAGGLNVGGGAAKRGVNLGKTEPKQKKTSVLKDMF